MHDHVVPFSDVGFDHTVALDLKGEARPPDGVGVHQNLPLDVLDRQNGHTSGNGTYDGNRNQIGGRNRRLLDDLQRSRLPGGAVEKVFAYQFGNQFVSACRGHAELIGKLFNGGGETFLLRKGTDGFERLSLGGCQAFYRPAAPFPFFAGFTHHIH